MRDGSVLPNIALAQSTMQMDWSKIELVVYATDAQKTAAGLICLPLDNKLHSLTLTKKDGRFVLENDPLVGKVAWKIKTISP